MWEGKEGRKEEGRLIERSGLDGRLDSRRDGVKQSREPRKAGRLATPGVRRRMDRSGERR
jgi:hypothetical protein